MVQPRSTYWGDDDRHAGADDLVVDRADRDEAVEGRGIGGDVGPVLGAIIARQRVERRAANRRWRTGHAAVGGVVTQGVDVAPGWRASESASACVSAFSTKSPEADEQVPSLIGDAERVGDVDGQLAAGGLVDRQRDGRHVRVRRWRLVDADDRRVLAAHAGREEPDDGQDALHAVGRQRPRR